MTLPDRIEIHIVEYHDGKAAPSATIEGPPAAVAAYLRAIAHHARRVIPPPPIVIQEQP